jgi:hypothetical protein
MALSSLTATFSSTFNYQGTKTETGFANALQNNNSPTKKVSLGTANANSAAGGADEVYAAVLSIAASGNTTINLSSFTDVVNQGSIGFARIKYYRFHLLSTSDDATNGTACTSISIGNAASHPFLFNWTLGGTLPTCTFTLSNGEVWEWGSPNGTGLTVTSGSNDQIYIVNNDGTHAAGVLVVLCGGTT